MELDEENKVSPGDQTTMAVDTTDEPSRTEPRGIAPVWHTVLLMIAILLVSGLGIYRHLSSHGTVVVNRLYTYGTTASFELALIGWVALGVRLRGIPLKSLFGQASTSFRSIMLDFGIAILFWMGALMALGTIAMTWMSVESLITRKPIPIQASKSGTPTLPQDQATRAVVELAPTNGKEVVCWVLLCMLVGIAEELVFRGYFQLQFTAWARGAIVAGVVLSALMFGAAHGYEGMRAMFLLTVFGGFFSGLALFRKNLSAGIFAHAWHDTVAGLTITFLHWHHIL
jgi:uncharacterized protein